MFKGIRDKGKGIGWIAASLGLILILGACQTLQSAIPTGTPIPLDTLMPASGSVPGWNAADPVQTYNRDNLYNLVDGQADAFFAYGFEQVAVQRYTNAAGVRLNVEIWQLSTTNDAYGLFHSGKAGQPATIGVEGDADPGRRLAFWQQNYFASASASDTVPDETLQAFAKAIASKLPAGGEVPAIARRLPTANLMEGSALFFHEEISIQMEVWLGGENFLGLSHATNGMVGRYAWGDQKARLLLIEYPATDEAAKGLKALQGSDVKDIAASESQGNLLAAVIGKVGAAQAQALVKEALK